MDDLVLGLSHVVWALLVSQAAVCVALAVFSRRWRRAQRKQLVELTQLRDDLNALSAGAVGMGQHLTRLEQRLKLVGERQDRIAVRPRSDAVYRDAIRLVRRGAGAETLMADCGLVREEAALLVSLHRLGEPS